MDIRKILISKTLLFKVVPCFSMKTLCASEYSQYVFMEFSWRNKKNIYFNKSYVVMCLSYLAMLLAQKTDDSNKWVSLYFAGIGGWGKAVDKGGAGEAGGAKDAITTGI